MKAALLAAALLLPIPALAQSPPKPPGEAPIIVAAEAALQTADAWHAEAIALAQQVASQAREIQALEAKLKKPAAVAPAPTAKHGGSSAP